MHNHKKNNKIHAHRLIQTHPPNTHLQTSFFNLDIIIMRKLHVLLFWISIKGHALHMERLWHQIVIL